MSKDYHNYLQFLASEHNILYIGKNSKAIYDDISNSFAHSSKIDLNEKTLDNIDIILTKDAIDIVIFDVQDNNPLIIEFFHKIDSFNEEILTLLMFEPKEYKKLFDVIPFVDINVSYPINKQIFQKKLFTLLSRSYTLNSIGRREIILKQTSVTESSIDKFFDTYEGSALFLADELMELVNELNNGNLSYELFNKIADKLDEVANIFSKTQQLNSVTLIYKDFSIYIRNLKLEDIQPQQLSSFTNLAEILSDVSIYLLDMFVDRIFKDVYIFEHSLQNNIEFTKNRLSGKSEDDDDSDLEFF